MKKLTAIYRFNRTSPIKHMVSTEYRSKKSFSEELRNNGFRVLAILNVEDIKKIESKEIYDLKIYEEYVQDVIINK